MTKLASVEEILPAFPEKNIGKRLANVWNEVSCVSGPLASQDFSMERGKRAKQSKFEFDVR